MRVSLTLSFLARMFIVFLTGSANVEVSECSSVGGNISKVEFFTYKSTLYKHYTNPCLSRMHSRLVGAFSEATLGIQVLAQFMTFICLFLQRGWHRGLWPILEESCHCPLFVLMIFAVHTLNYLDNSKIITEEQKGCTFDSKDIFCFYKSYHNLSRVKENNFNTFSQISTLLLQI